MPQFHVAIQKLRGQGKVTLQDKGNTSGWGGGFTAEEEVELRNLFDSIDTDGSGTIEMDEYFLWTLDIASNQGYGLEVVFRKYDTSGEGTLDAAEFALAVEDLGFTATFAHDLFVELDDDNSGAVSYAELTQTLRERARSVSDGTKKFLTTLAFHDANSWSKSEQTSKHTGRRALANSVGKQPREHNE